MKHFKIIHTETGETMCYACCENDDDAGDICEIFGLDEYSSEEVSKEEFVRETEGVDVE